MSHDWEYENDEEWDDEPAFDDDFETETVECTHCGAEIYEDAVSCPICGEYISRSTGPLTDRPPWWVTLGILGVIATILSLIFLF